MPAADVGPHLDHFLVGKSGGAVVGVVGLEPIAPCGLLRSLAVAPQFRGKGVARALCSRIEAHAGQQGVRALYLLTTRAGAFFAKAGFKPVRRDAVPEGIRSTLEFTRLCPASATAMLKELGGQAG